MPRTLRARAHLRRRWPSALGNLSRRWVLARRRIKQPFATASQVLLRVMPPLKQRSRRSMRALLAQIRPVPHGHRHQPLLLLLLIRVVARHLVMAC